MYALRTRFAKDIICEFLPPLRKIKHDKVIIFCEGHPGIPGKQTLMEFYARKGYWVFVPRYRGSWESDGKFLKRSPHLDILDVLNGLKKNFVDFWSNKKYIINPKHISIIGHSFGGPAALLLSKDPRINKVIGLAPVVDWQAPSETEPLDWLFTFTKNAFGNAYRVTKKDWYKLKNGKFYNPTGNPDKIAAKKVLLIHAKDDNIVSYKSVEKFAITHTIPLVTLKKGGHLSSKILLTPKLARIVREFLAK